MTNETRSKLSNVFRWSVSIDKLRPEGEVLVVRGSEEPASSALFLRVNPETPIVGSVELQDRTRAIAFLNVCTHMGCELVRGDCAPLPDCEPPGTIVVGPCPCHGTRFDLARGGLVVLGPATADLPQLELELTEDTLVATLTDQSLDPRCEAWPGRG